MTSNYHGIEIDLSRDSLLTSAAIEMLMEFYSMPGETSPQHMYARAALAWSTYHGNTDYKLANRLYGYASKKWMMFASPVLSNAPAPDGTKRGLPISCFLSYVPDTVPGLIDHSTELRWLSVMGGGVGGHWSDVRSVSKIAPGPIPFMHTVDADMAAYKQGSNRRGSYAAYLSVDHPDIMEFISIRVPTGDTNRKAFNLHNAVGIPDYFIEKCRNDENYELIDPKKGPTGEFLSARKVFEKLIETRFRTGEPYLHFIDKANDALPESQKALGLKVHGSNLCIEIHLATAEDRTAVCCLSSPNLELFDEWEHSLMLQDMVVALDNVLEYFIETAPPALWRAVNSAKRERAIGIGLMGWHSYLQRKCISFESEEALQLNKDIAMYFQSATKQASRDLYFERGEPEDMKGTELRNSHLLAIAPNASSGFIIGTSPSGELNKANAYTHRTRAGSFLVTNPYLKSLLQLKGKDTDDVWNSIITTEGSVQHLDFLTEVEKALFKTSFEVDQHWVIKHAAARQPYVCQGQSVNLFFSSDAPRDYVLSVHMLAHKMNLKGLYYLRTQSKQRPENVSASVEMNKMGDNKPKSIVYGKPGCPQCNIAKDALKASGIDFEYIDIVAIGKTAAEVTGDPGVRSLPQVVIEGELVGGLASLLLYLKKKEQLPEDDECKACEG